MKVIDPGHKYKVNSYDGKSIDSVITFMKREGEGYPGNVGHHAGTNCQEVIRVLIDRVKYLDRQIPCDENKNIIAALRETLAQFELRAARRHGRSLMLTQVDIENIPTCKQCGHIGCGHEDH